MPPIRPGTPYGAARAAAATAQAARQARRYGGVVTRAGQSTCDVLYDGGTQPTPGLPYQGAIAVGQRVEIREVDGVSTVFGSPAGAGAVVVNAAVPVHGPVIVYPPGSGGGGTGPHVAGNPIGLLLALTYAHS